MNYFENSKFVKIAFIVFILSIICGLIGTITSNTYFVGLWFLGLNAGAGMFIGDYLAFMLFKAEK